jgi:hypothetical protein
MGMNRIASRRAARLTWRVFSPRDGSRIESQLQEGRAPRCPCCGEVLEARPGSRLTRSLPLDASGHDLDCRDCRRFWCMVRHTARSLRLIRMRRLVAAIRAVDPAPEEPVRVASSGAA